MPTGIYIRTEAHKAKTRLSCVGVNRGIIRSEEFKRKISLSKTGVPSKKKGIKTGIVPKSAFIKGYIPWNKKNFITKIEKAKRIRKTKEELLAKKRFRNQRYKANKRKAGGTHTYTEWLFLKNYYKNMCLCCKKQEPSILLTEDHIIPLSMGGSDDINNIQPLCNSCNTRKHTKTLSYLPVGSINSFFALPN